MPDPAPLPQPCRNTHRLPPRHREPEARGRVETRARRTSTIKTYAHIAAALCLWIIAGPAASAHTYRISLSDDLRTLSATACFDDDSVDELRAGDPAAHRYLANVRWAKPDRSAPRVRGQTLKLAALASGDCLLYDVNVGAAADAGELRRSGWVGRDLLTTPEIWFWRPGVTVDMQFDLPDGVQVSAPWPITATAPDRYRAGTTAARWSSLVAFGRFETRPVTVAGKAAARLAVMDESAFERPDDMARWISEAAAAVGNVYGSFPRRQTQILVVPSNRGSSAVPWGQVLRGGAPAAHFFVNPDRPLSDFRADWTASHELSHLLLPYVRRSDAWLSEGFASYYQNVARGRAGMLSREEAWDKLYLGYQRGMAGTREGESLRLAARSMRQNGGYMRVYWSGAAIALIADVALREQSGNDMTLNLALARLGDCCMDPRRSWSARSLLRKLDELTDTDVFSTLRAEHIDSTEFPDVAATLARLGVQHEDGKTTLRDDAPLASIRRAIMAAPSN